MWNNSIKEVLEYLKTSLEGLTQEEAEKRLKENGKNTIPKAKQETIFEIFINQFKSPIIAILIIAAIFSIITKSYADSIFIFAVIIINSIIGTYQEWNSEKNSKKLEEMIRINSKVLRDRNANLIDSENIVVGDIVLLESGDKIPADLRLIEASELSIDESILTGESIPKLKDIEIQEKDTKLVDRLNIAYAGTVVTKGRGKGIVISVGKDTEFGKVAENVIESKEAKSPLIIRMEKFSKQISIGFIIFATIMAIILYLKSYNIADIFSTIVALTVSAIPEGLTIAMTIVLSISASKMAKKNVIVKKLNAVESLGSCTQIATDKTGTLTVNEQTAKKVLLPNDDLAYITGTGYNDKGSIETEENISKQSYNQIKEIVKIGVLNNEASLKFENGEWTHHGDAIDIAFLALGYKLDIKKDNNIVGMIPYESRLKYSSVLYEEKINNEKMYFSTVKGGVEEVLQFCDKMQCGNEITKLDYNKIINQADNLSKDGFRVIALAKGKSESPNNKYSEKEIPKLIYMGMVAFVDPIRQDVTQAIKECKKAGIGVTMITGDYKLTAEAIAKRLDIDNVYSRVTPMEKLEIVEKFKNNDEFIAVTGDGVNDTPALKAANIGVAMGSGTDIAKEVGNMIIVDDNFSTIVKGVEEGRRAYNNIRKVIYLLLSTGFSEIILFVFSIIFGLPIPLLAIQLLWLNLISNGIQGDALAFEKDIENVMNKKAKKKGEKIFNKLLVNEIFVSSLVMAIVEFVVYFYLINIKLYNIETTRALLLTLMVFMENIHILNCRSENISIFKISLKNNVFLIISIIVTSLIQILIVSSKTLSSFFRLNTIGIREIIILFVLTIPVIIAMEIFKLVKIKFSKLTQDL